MSTQVVRIVALPEELSLRTVTSVRDLGSDAMASKDDVVIECSGLMQVDFAGLQLLVSAFQTSDAVGAVTLGILVDKVFEVTEISSAQTQATPRLGMNWRPEFIRFITKWNDDFVIVPDLEKILA